MDIESLVAVFAVLLTIALAAERLIEIFKPIIEKIQDPNWLTSAKVGAAVLVGFGLAALFRFDMLARLSVTGTLPVVGYAAAGLVASVGSSTLHALLEWLKTLQQPANKTTFTQTTRTEITPAEVANTPG
jgi:hypothetical protein